LVKRVADAMKGGHYPRSSDAKIVVDQLQKVHLNKRRKKLEVHRAILVNFGVGFVKLITTHA